MAIRVNFALSEQKIHQNISKKQNQNSLLDYCMEDFVFSFFTAPFTKNTTENKLPTQKIPPFFY